jgi:hypothetical protein
MSLANEIRNQFNLPLSTFETIVECIRNCGRIKILCTRKSSSNADLEWLDMRCKPSLIKWAQENGFYVNERNNPQGVMVEITI